MDIIAFNEAATANERIEKIVANPDSVAGLVSVPNLVPTGETITIPAGRTVVHPNLQVDGVLDIQGDLFIPSGGTYTTDAVSVDTVNIANNLVMASGTKIQGDFSNSNISSRTAFQSSTLNGNTNLQILPNGNAVASALQLFGIDSSTSNSSILVLQANQDAGGAYNSIRSDRTGAGAYLGLLFYTGGAERLRIDTSGNVLVTGLGGLGYGTGSGGTVTQLTSKSTTVTLNKPSGQITMNNASLASNTVVSFTINNTNVTANDCVVLTVLGGATYGAYQFTATTGVNNSFIITVRNVTAGALADGIILQFDILKGATA